MHLARKAALPGLLVLTILGTILGCGNKAVQQRDKSKDTIVGTWRDIDDQQGGMLVFAADGTYRAVFPKPKGALPDELAAMAEAMEQAPARYNRRGDKEIVVSYDVKALRRALAKAPNFGPDMFTGATFDLVYTYEITGDLLELTADHKTRRYGRVQATAP
jgi:hypothetical protein